MAAWLLVFSGVMGTMTDTFAVTTPWAVIKCKFSDQPQEPVFDEQFIVGPFGMAGYWAEASYNRISLDGSTIFPANGGWYTLPFTLAESVKLTRLQKIDACIAAATGVDTSKFYSVIAIINAAIDSGASGGKVLLDPLAWNVSFAGHEMGHVYIGPQHSYDDTLTVYCPGYRPGEYGNGWDIMSAMAFGGDSTTFAGTYGTSGPGLNGPNLDKLGWLNGDRVVTWDGTSMTVTLAALNRPLAGGYLMAKVPIDTGNPKHYYTVEFRRKIDWDKGIPQNTVLIHEVRADGLSYLIRADGGPERLPDRTFHDPGNNVNITVLSMDSVSSTATVNIGHTEVWVDFGHAGAIEFGNFEFPFNTLAEGLNTVAYDGTLRMKAGSKNETVIISRKMRIEAYGGPVTIGK